MNEQANLRTAVRVTLGVGSGLVLAPALILLDPGDSAPDFFQTAARIQIVVGCFVLGVGLALWRRQPWGRIAALLLMRVAIVATVAWAIYANLDAAKMAPTSGTFIGASVLVTIIWVFIFLKGITYLNQPSLRAELEHGVQ